MKLVITLSGNSDEPFERNQLDYKIMYFLEKGFRIIDLESSNFFLYVMIEKKYSNNTDIEKERRILSRELKHYMEEKYPLIEAKYYDYNKSEVFNLDALDAEKQTFLEEVKEFISSNDKIVENSHMEKLLEEISLERIVRNEYRDFIDDKEKKRYEEYLKTAEIYDSYDKLYLLEKAEF